MARSSRLAWLLRAVIALLAILSAWWVMRFWPSRPGLALLGPLVALLVGPILISIEFVLLVLVGRNERVVAAPGARRLFDAWRAECVEVYRVFYWRQPFRWNAEADHLPPSARDRRALVLVHGYLCNRGFWNPWMVRARAAGVPFVAVNLEPVFTSVDEYAAIIDDAVRQATQATGLPPVLVGHSMGGLAIRVWLRDPAAAARIHRVVTIGTPHTGTFLGHISLSENGRQMAIGSDWLLALEAAGVPPGVPITCWYGDCDNTVFPVHHAMLEGADNRLVPGAAHVDLAFHEEVVRETFALVTSGA